MVDTLDSTDFMRAAVGSVNRFTRTMYTRYAILHHKTNDGEHWDLMLEKGDVLLTWQLMRDPHGGEVLPIDARCIGDHRKAYLTYEGPISDGRGEVRRVDQGRVAFLHDSKRRIVIELSGGRLCGTFLLAEAAGKWTLAAMEAT